jgi:hypothetical protein
MKIGVERMLIATGLVVSGCGVSAIAPDEQATEGTE